MRRVRSSDRNAPALPPAGKGRGGGVGASAADRRVSPPPPTPPRKGEESGAALAADTLVLLGEFGRAHGLKGEVRLKSHTGDPQAIASYGPLVAADGRTIRLRSVRPAPGGAPGLLVAQVEGVSSREAADALNRLRLFLPRPKLPAPDAEDEYLLADLIGLGVETASGQSIGRVVDVPNYGGGDLLEIASRDGGATALLPFTKTFVPLVDLAAGRIVVEAPGDLFETGSGKPEPTSE